jgi:hypothetical protein
VPLAELVILAGIVSLAIGVIGGNPTLIGVGVACAGLGGLEVAILTTGLVFYVANQILAVALAVGAVAFAITFYLARRAFQRASGGLSYRVGGMRG